MKKLLLGCAVLLATALAPAAEPMRVPDVAVTDQNGRELHFYSDLVRGKVVAISFIFTSCTTICTPIGAKMAALQPALASHGEVRLISVSIDPATDTPQRLKSWSEKFKPRPGWTLVTGSKKEITRLLAALRAESPNPASHSPILLVGNDATGRWTRVSSLNSVDAIVTAIDGVRTRKEGAGR
jgi:protein SCO1/2